MLIYSVGAPSPHEVFTEIQVLHTLRREAALAIVSDDENPATVLAAIRCGARGYFSNSMAPELALHALSFVLHGGTYFPPTAFLASQTFSAPPPIEYKQPDLPQEQLLPGSEQQTQAPPLRPEDGLYEQQGSLFDDKPAGVQRDHGFNGARHTPEFTDRQYSVLVCLCQGDPNKVIGRKLGMTETTVKVHVREIMRKLGVSNRTQVAIAGAHVCSDSAAELVPADSSMAIKPSISHQR
ncbi:response regulator transcription factor [Bradyrhizobium sp. 190]|nr:response regulator transcription factor [Bradyrhizobium sp. 190]